MFRVLIVTFALAGSLGVAPELVARDYDDEYGVARLSLIHGDVSVRRGDSGDWTAGAINAPLVARDVVQTGPGARAEIQLDYAHHLRLDEQTEVRLTQLEYRRYLIQIPIGNVTMSVLRDHKAEVELSTAAVSLRPSEPGLYRVTVLEDGRIELTARRGEAEVYGPRGVERLRGGRTMLVRGDPSDPEFQHASATPRDRWDEWNEDRDRQIKRSEAYRYVHHDIYGAEDLDGHGEWVHSPGYGRVWRPYVSADWAPYRQGRWVWMDYYGWSWLSYDPWGWAPYHYGRWFFAAGQGWCWYPGAIGYPRYHWRPALVTFFGFGSGGVRFGVGVGWGNVGWVPLAPYETYHPWYGRGLYRGYRNRGYVDRSVTIVNNVNVYNNYRNARIRNAVTAVSVDQFGRGNRNFVNVRGDSLRRTDVVRGAVPLAPGEESVRFSDRSVGRGEMRRTPDRGFYASRQAPQRERASFEEQRQGMERLSRSTFGDTASGRGSSGRRTAETAVTGAPGNIRGGGGSPASETGASNRGGLDRSGGSRDGGLAREAGIDRRTAGVAEERASGGWRSTDGSGSGGERAGGLNRSGTLERGVSLDRGVTLDGDQTSGRRTASETDSGARSWDSGGSRINRSPGGWRQTREQTQASQEANSDSNGSGGWRTFGEPLNRDRGSAGRRTDTQRNSGARSAGESGAWERFGQPVPRTGGSMRRTPEASPDAASGGESAPVRSRVWGDRSSGEGRRTADPSPQVDRSGSRWSNRGSDRQSGGGDSPQRVSPEAGSPRSLDVNPRILERSPERSGSSRGRYTRSSDGWRSGSGSIDNAREPAASRIDRGSDGWGSSGSRRSVERPSRIESGGSWSGGSNRSRGIDRSGSFGGGEMRRSPSSSSSGSSWSGGAIRSAPAPSINRGSGGGTMRSSPPSGGGSGGGRMSAPGGSRGGGGRSGGRSR